MNEISLLNNFIIELFSQQPLVNTITIVPTIDMDGNKENIYPLVNIDLIETDIQTDAFVVSYTITVVQQREYTPKKTNNKLMDDTNYLDNLNETHSIAAKFINYLRWQNNDLVIVAESVTPLKKIRKNSLDGVQFDIDLSIHNSGRAGN